MKIRPTTFRKRNVSISFLHAEKYLSAFKRIDTQPTNWNCIIFPNIQILNILKKIIVQITK